MVTENEKPLEWRDLWDELNRKNVSGDDSWTLTTEDMYYEMLNSVPPRDYFTGGFAAGEPVRHSRNGALYHAFKVEGNKYYAKLMEYAY